MKFLAGILSFIVCAASVQAADMAQVLADAARYESGASVEPLRAIEQAVRESVGDPTRKAEVERHLTQLLAPSATFEARRFACTQLAIVGGEDCLEPLAAMLKEPQTTGIACLALASNPSPKVNSILQQALARARDMARVQIIVTLGDRRDQESVRALIPLTRNADGPTAESAIASLGKIASDEALAALKELRETGDPALARAAWQATLVAADLRASHGETSKADELYKAILASGFTDYARRAAFEGLLRLHVKEAQERILETLKGKDDVLKPSAIAAASSIQGDNLSSALAAQLEVLKPEHQVLLLQALAKRNDKAAMDAVRKATASANSAVRRAAVEALGRYGDAESVGVLVQALGKSETTEDRQAIVAALTGLKGGESVDRAVADELTRTGASTAPLLISVLGKRANPASFSVILEQTRVEDTATARAAFNALGSLARSDDLPALLDALTGLKAQDARGAAETAVAKVLAKTPSPSRRTEAVASAVKQTRSLEARCSLLALLPSCGDAAALTLLKEATNDAESRVRDTALRALADWPDSAALSTLINLARTASQDTERVLAIRGAARLLSGATDLQPGDAAERFQALFALVRNSDEKKLLLSGLGRIRHPTALALVANSLDDTNAQAEAALAAVTIAPYVAVVKPEATTGVLRKITHLPLDPEIKQTATNLQQAIEGFADYVMAWQVAGPFAKEGFPGKDIFEEPFLPERDPASSTWAPMPAGTDRTRPWLLDLGKFLGGQNCAAYARTWVHSETNQNARLELGSDDGVKAWLNGTVVVSANRGGDVKPGDQKADVQLRTGWNPLVLKITQWTSGWGFCARFTKPDGSTLPGLRYSPTPP